MNEYYFVQTNKEIQANENIQQVLYKVDENEKLAKLHEILQGIQGSVISN